MTKERERLLFRWDYCERTIAYCDEQMKIARCMMANAQDEFDYQAQGERWAFYFDLKSVAQTLRDDTTDDINTYDIRNQKGGD